MGDSYFSRASYFSSLYIQFLLFGAIITEAVASEKPLQGKDVKVLSYEVGQAVPVTCLNRTIDTGEHITDAQGQLQYIPFPICNETNRPLELVFGVEKEINCTIPSLPDSLFHLLEFYIHNDAPLTCRIPTRPLPTHPAPDSATTHPYTPLQFALAGTLQLSHLHITPTLNIILHTAADEEELLLQQSSTSSSSSVAKTRRQQKEGSIIAAAAYSVPPLPSVPSEKITSSSSGSSSTTGASLSNSASPRLIIGDPLPLRLNLRWYATRSLPASTVGKPSGLGGHVHLSTVVYCLVSAGLGAAVSFAYFRGWDLPRRMRSYKGDRIGVGGGGGGYAFPGGMEGGRSSSYGGYGYGGKMD
ncbi:hypothetical protein MMC25_000634 [Agyrium rufum]|nr:hypothetical protein [Agyrium rufum]